MIDKKISVSEQVSNLPIEAQVVFTWGITHADDIGLLQHSHRTLKAMIVPMWDCSTEQFDKYVEAITKEGLWKEIEHEEQKFYLITRFHGHQTLKKDRQPQTILNITLDKNPKRSWSIVEKVVETFGIHLEDTDFQMESEVKRSEVKRREKNKGKKPYGELKNVFLSDEEKVKLIEKYGRSPVKQLVEDLSVYIPNKAGKPYTDHYATILTWARRKGLEIQRKPEPKEPEPEISEEQAAENRKKLAKISEGLKTKFKMKS